MLLQSWYSAYQTQSWNGRRSMPWWSISSGYIRSLECAQCDLERSSGEFSAKSWICIGIDVEEVCKTDQLSPGLEMWELFIGTGCSATILKCRKFSGGWSNEVEANMLFSGLDVKVVTNRCFLDGFISDQEITWSRRCWCGHNVQRSQQ